MKQYKVEITKSALQDMEDIYNYIAEELLAPENAMGQYNRIADAILSLDTFPEKFRLLESEPEKAKEIRRMVVDNYSVFRYCESLQSLIFVGIYHLIPYSNELRKSTLIFQGNNRDSA